MFLALQVTLDVIVMEWLRKFGEMLYIKSVCILKK